MHAHVQCILYNMFVASDEVYVLCIIFLVYLIERVLYNMIVVPDGIDSVNPGGLQANLGGEGQNKSKNKC